MDRATLVNAKSTILHCPLSLITSQRASVVRLLYRLRNVSYLAHSANLPDGIYILLALISSFSLFLLGAKLSQYLLDRFSQSLHHMVGIQLQMINPTFFFRYLKGCCHGNQFCGKITYPLALITLASRKGTG